MTLLLLPLPLLLLLLLLPPLQDWCPWRGHLCRKGDIKRAAAHCWREWLQC
jgi:hypothetical protein